MLFLAWNYSPESIPLQIIFLSGLFCSFVVHVAYTGAILSTLSVSYPPVQDFMDLVNQKFTFTVYIKSDPFQQILKVCGSFYSTFKHLLGLLTAICENLSN